MLHCIHPLGSLDNDILPSILLYFQYIGNSERWYDVQCRAVSKSRSKCYKCMKLKQTKLNQATKATEQWLLVVWRDSLYQLSLEWSTSVQVRLPKDYTPENLGKKPTTTASERLFQSRTRTPAWKKRTKEMITRRPFDF